MNIHDMSGYSPWLFTQIDSVVTLTILAIFGLMVLVKDNFKALSVLYGLIITGMMVMASCRSGRSDGIEPGDMAFLAEPLPVYGLLNLPDNFLSIASSPVSRYGETSVSLLS